MATKHHELVISSIPTAWALLIWINDTCINIPPSAVIVVIKFALNWLASQRPELYQQLVVELNEKPAA